MASRNIRLDYGLMSLAAKIEGAVEKPPSFSNMCLGQPEHDDHDPEPVKQPKTCPHCGPITDPTRLVKGLKEGSSFKVITQEEVADTKEKFSGEYKKAINLLPHPAHEFLTRTAPGDSLYYVTPADKTGENVYQLLVKLLTEHPDVVLAGLHTPVSATSLYMLGVRDGVLTLEQRARTQALKPAPSVGGSVDDRLYEMLDKTTEALMTPYNPDDYEDGYATAIKEIAATREAVTVSTGSGKTATVVASDTEDSLRAKLQEMMMKEAVA